MNFYGQQFRTIFKNYLQSVHPILVTGLAGSGKLHCTKIALQDANVDFKLINVDKYYDIGQLYREVSNEPDKVYLIDLVDNKLIHSIKPLLERGEVMYATKSIQLKFNFTGRLIVVCRELDGIKESKSIIDRCLHIEG